MKKLLTLIFLLLLTTKAFGVNVLEKTFIPGNGFCVHSRLDSTDISPSGFIFIDFPDQVITVDTYSTTLGMNCSQVSVFNGFVYESMSHDLQACLVNKIHNKYRVKGFVQAGSMFFYMLQCNKCGADAEINISAKNKNSSKGQIYYQVICSNYGCGNKYAKKIKFNF